MVGNKEKMKKERKKLVLMGLSCSQLFPATVLEMETTETPLEVLRCREDRGCIG